MPRLVLGPLLRHVGDDHATVWVETDSPCEVEVLGASSPTFHVAGHHYALVRPEGLAEGSWHEYDVRLDGELAWPPPDSPYPPSRFHTYPIDRPLRVAFGSCRSVPPGRGPDALVSLADRMRRQEPEDWPQLLLMLGDQVYADEVSPETLTFMEARRDLDRPPGDCVLDFEEYSRLYHESWGEPTIRWLLSTLSTAMVFDDHDMHDDWNTSAAWVESMRALDWWEDHVAGAFSSYWIYQHLGNLGHGPHADDDLLARVRQAEDGAPLLRDFALRADRETDAARWSYCRDLGRTRLVVVDSRAGRVLEEGRRTMVDDAEWDWIAEHATGGHDHLLIATSLPFLLGAGMHWIEAWSEAVCGGAWGPRAAAIGERARQAADLEHWAAFADSFARLSELMRSVAAGERGAAPASIVALSGDVHHAYLAEVAFRRGSGAESAVWQAVCSPFRNPLDGAQRAAVRLGFTRPLAALARMAARAAGVEDPPIRWRLTGGGPWFDNHLGMLEIDGRRLDLRIELTRPGGGFTTALERRLA